MKNLEALKKEANAEGSESKPLMDACACHDFEHPHGCECSLATLSHHQSGHGHNHQFMAAVVHKQCLC